MLKIAGLEPTEPLDGEDLSEVLLGKSEVSRSAPIFFRRPPDRKSFYDTDNLPDFAMGQMETAV